MTNKQLTFSHSGTTGDTFCSLVIPKILGGGDFYLKLNNLENTVKQQLGWSVTGRHAGRMTQEDFDVMEELVKHQPYINDFKVWNGEQIDHELEYAASHLETKSWPRNFSNQHAEANGIDTEFYKRDLQAMPWMECREERKFPGRPIVIHRSPNYLDNSPLQNPTWKNFIDRGLVDQAVFVGQESDHAFFEETFKVSVPHYRTPDWMELARVIQGSEMMITSMGGPSALCLCLGKTMMLEPRKNEPHERLEINYPYRLNIQYF
jgi:hypothetical protein